MKALITRKRSQSRSNASRGFSLVEVLVALVVVSVGLLGLAKMEALSLSSTSVAGVRSITAGQAANLAAMMHANQDFWQTPIVYPLTTITSSSNPYAGATACTVAGSSSCTPTQMANADLNLWAQGLAAALPVYSATVKCSTVLPISCVIQITWSDNAVAMTTQQSQGIANLAALPTYYTLYVQP
jgi:type IV pilus assembly protein PilV